MGLKSSDRPAAICAVILCICCVVTTARSQILVTNTAPGRTGGKVTIALRSDPKTLNPALATDIPTRDIIYCMNADLIHINRQTQLTESALAKLWRVSRDGRTYTLQLRRGIRFSDGQPFTADDVVFTFRVYEDEKIDSPIRDLLIVGGKPVTVEKVDDYTVRFHLAQPYGAAERLFDGMPILPKHLLESAYRNGNFSKQWNISAAPSEIAGLGPFRLKEYVPGQRIVLERNPYYWKADRTGTHLPYLDEIEFLFVPSEDAQVIRFESGDTDILEGFGAQDYSVLEREAPERHYHLYDLGPGLEYNFIFFNLNDLTSKNLPQIAEKQSWFRDVRFRQAVSNAVDRDGIVRLVYGGKATPLWSQVTPGNKLWTDSSLPHPATSIEHARELLKSAGFSWRADGALLDARGKPVEFSILTSSSNAERTKTATIIQDDLSQLGMHVQVVSIDFHTMVDRLLNSFNYEAAVMGIASGDTDPTAEMNVWVSNGGTHLWHLNETKPATPWEEQIDRLMNEQMVTMNYKKRKQLYDQVQQVIGQNAPVIFTASPHILAGAKDRVGNFRPSILDPYVLWNIEELYAR